MDGSGKKAKVKIKVVAFQSDKTAAPTAAPDTRKTTTLEDFESYDAGTAWTKYTAAGKNSGHMTVVTDPENSENKCLKVTMDGTESAFDFAPVLTVDLSQLKDSLGNSTAGKTLGNYTGIKVDARVVGNDSDVQYKKIFCYFDQAGNIKTSDFFATTNNETSSAHVDGHPEYRFGVNISMAEGSETEVGTVLWNGKSTKESNKYFPLYYSTWQMENASTHYLADTCSTGYKMTEDEAKVGFATRSLTFNTGRINEADSTLLQQSKFDVVLGSTYKGAPGYAETNTNVTYYIDNIALVEEEIPVTGIELTANAERLGTGTTTGKVTVSYTPDNTTQKGVVWTTSNDKVKVDSEGNITVAEDFDFAGVETPEVVITATSTADAALTKSVTIQIYKVEKASENHKIDLTAALPVAEKDADGNNIDADLKVWSDVTPTANEDGSIVIPYTAVNQSIVIDLGETMDLSGYQGISITGNVPQQMSLELYDENFDMRQANWYRAVDNETEPGQLRWCTYPFYNGSCVGRAEDGTNSGVDGEETCSYIWAEGSTKGDVTKIRYVLLKTNQSTLFKKKTYTISDVSFIVQ